MIDPAMIIQNNIRRRWASGTRPITEITFTTIELQYSVVEVVYDTLAMINLPPLSLQSSSFKNDTDAQSKQTFAVNKQTSDSFTWSITEALSISYEYSVKVPLIGDSTWKFNLSLSSTQAQTTSVTRQWTYSAEVPIPPRSTVETSFLVQEGRVSTPFKMTLQAHGKIMMTFNLNPAGQPPDWRVYGGDIDDLLSRGTISLGEIHVNLTGVFTGISGNNYNVETHQRVASGQLVTTMLDFGFHSDVATEAE